MLERMVAAIAHRGPDDRGVHAGEWCGLASARLSILDLESGHMPLANEDGTVHVTYNGEIYNHRALRASLLARGHHFATRSDTEVLVHLYEERGAEMLPELSGMFAFALWDQAKRRLLLARDRFGIKPLLLSWSTDRRVLLFASEAKAIFAAGPVSPRLSRRALGDVLSAGYPLSDRTMFEGVSSLPPASCLALTADGSGMGREVPSTWWSMPYPSRGAGLVKRRTLEQAAEELRGLLAASVADHLVADVPVGSYLSGGLDSVSVAALASRAVAPAKLRTFSMVFTGPDAMFDESAHSGMAAEAIGSAHEKIELRGITREDYAGTIRAMEAPQVHTVAFCLYQLSRLVRSSGLKVILSGEGADEIFAGYGAFRLARFRRLVGPRLRTWLAKLVLRRRQPRLAEDVARWWRVEAGVAERYGLVPPWVETWWLLSEASASALTPSAAAMIPDGLPEIGRVPGIDGRNPLHADLLFEQRTRLDGWVLPLGDRLTMAHSVEGRVPFLDPRVVELAAVLPPRFLLRGMREKHVLRAAMQPSLPPALGARRKRAFMAPIVGWLFGAQPPEWVREALDARSLAETGIFDAEAIRGLLAVTAAGKKDLATLEASWVLNLALGTVMLSREMHAGL